MVTEARGNSAVLPRGHPLVFHNDTGRAIGADLYAVAGPVQPEVEEPILGFQRNRFQRIAAQGKISLRPIYDDRQDFHVPTLDLRYGTFYRNPEFERMCLKRGVSQRVRDLGHDSEVFRIGVE